MSFEIIEKNIAGKPDIVFRFRGDTVRAELGLCSLYGERTRHGVRLWICDDGQVLGCITVHADEETMAQSVACIGSALLWSNYAYRQAKLD